jgi:hypothetical protein
MRRGERGTRSMREASLIPLFAPSPSQLGR